MTAPEVYHRLLLAIRAPQARRLTHLYVSRGRTVAAVHWWPAQGVVEVDRFTPDGELDEIEAHDARALRDAIAAGTYRRPWRHVAARLLATPIAIKE